MKKLACGLVTLMLMAWVVAAAVPAFSAEGDVTAKPLSRIEFAQRFHGLPDGKLMDRKYTEYRSGLIPAPTLSEESMR